MRSPPLVPWSAMRVAVLGLGFMGSTHVKALSSIPDACLYAVLSNDDTKLAGDLTAVRGNIGAGGGRFDFSGVRRYRTVDGLLSDPDIDAVDICLPTYLHAETAIQALRAGKHVLVEKPMALDRASADAMIAESERSRRILMIAQVLRFFPEYVALREAVAGDVLGRVRHAVFRRRCAAPGWGGWLADPARSGGGVFDLLIHDVDMAVHLFGVPESVTATGFENAPAGIDVITGTLHYPTGLTVIVTGGWQHPRGLPVLHGIHRGRGWRDRGVQLRHAATHVVHRLRRGAAPDAGSGGRVRRAVALFPALLRGAEAARSMPAGRVGRRCFAAAAARRVEKAKRRANTMQNLKKLEPGAMFWAGRDTLVEIARLGVRCGQLGVPGTLELDNTVADDWKAALDQEAFALVTVFAAFTGEDYADIPTVQRTVGFIPRATRIERFERMCAVSDFAAALGVGSVACHIGFVPEEQTHADYVEVRELVRRFCDYAARHEQSFALETGQETARALLEFLQDVDRPNIAINFDPANMVLYGTGDPVAALRQLGAHVISVHCKDAIGPEPADGINLGTEMPLGQGSVGMERFIRTLRVIGFSGPLNIERECGNQEERLRDMAAGVELLRMLAS